MSTTLNRQRSYLGAAACVFLTLACGAFPLPSLEQEPTATATGTGTTTPTLSPAQSMLTEFARQAEGTRQVLEETQVALMQNIDATATARSLDATATMLAPLPSVDEQVDVQANVMWKDTGIPVRLGDVVQIRYVTGEWTIWIDADPLTDGNGQYGRDETCRILPEANLGGLIGRVGDSPPFFIGNGADLYSDYNGTLQLSINDCPQFGNNAGALTVSVVIDR